MLVSLRLAAGSVASVAVTVEAISRSPEGWTVIVGYTHAMTPILACVADAGVIDIEVEPLMESDASDDETAEWFAEAA